MSEEKSKISFWKKKWHNFLLKLEGKISKWRKHTIVDLETHFWVSQPLRQANAFLSKLYSNDDFYYSARYAWTRPEDSKKLFLYGCARQVIKASTTLLENTEHILEIPKSKDMDTLERIILEALIDEQNVILRKHIESLVNIINFSNFDKGEAYRIFLNAENLEHFLSRQSDFGTFYESKSGNTDSSIKTFSDRVKDDLDALKIKNIWFLRKDWEKKRNPPVFESVRKRFILALPYAADEEKIAMGISYDGFFAKFSASAHASAGSRFFGRQQKFSEIKNNISFISMLGQHIIHRANKLMGFDDPDDVMQRMILENASHAPRLIQRFKRIFYAGDLVLAGGDLSEIVECKQSKYGYTSCKIRYLTRPPLPEIPEDWLPSDSIIMILPKSRVREFLLKNKDKPDTPNDLKDVLVMMEKESDDNLTKYAQSAMVKLHQEGILIPALLDSGMIRRREDLEEDD